MGSQTPKQFIKLAGKPILIHTLQQISQITAKSEFIVVLPETQIDYWKDLCQKFDFNLKHHIVAGGKTRFQSVKNGLSLVQTNSMVAVHDGVRPFISKIVFESCMKQAAISGAAIPCLPISDSLRKKTTNGSEIRDRNLYVSVQTPQCFKSEILIEAYKQNYNPKFSDDASVVENISVSIQLIEGNKENIKITTPEDLKTALAYLS